MQTPERFGYIKQYEVETATGKNIVYSTFDPDMQTKTRTAPVYISQESQTVFTTSKDMPKEVQVNGQTFKVVYKSDPGKIPTGLQTSEMSIIEQKAARGDVTFKITDPVKVKAQELKQRKSQLIGIYGDKGKELLKIERQSMVLSSWEDPIGLRSAYQRLKGIKTGRSSGTTERELGLVEARTHLEMESWRILPPKQRAIASAASPVGTIALSFFGGTAVGAGMGALGRVAPTVGKVAQVGLGTLAVGGIGLDVGREIKAKDYETAFVKAGFYAITLPVASLGYKGGYKKGYSYASKKWIEKNFVVSQTKITSKQMMGDNIYYEGTYYGRYRPDFETKTGFIRGKFAGIAPAKQTLAGPVLVQPGDAYTVFSGKAHYTKFGKARTQDVTSMSMTYKPFFTTDQGGQYSRFKALGKTGGVAHRTVGLSHLQKGPLLTEFQHTQIGLKYYDKPYPGAKGDILGYTYLDTPDIHIKKGLSPKWEKRVIKHELIHQRLPFASEAEVLALEKTSMPFAEGLIKDYMKSGDLKFYKTTGVKEVQYSRYQSISMSETVTGTLSAQAEKGTLSEIMAKKSIKGVKTYQASTMLDTKPTVILEVFPAIGHAAKPEVYFPVAGPRAASAFVFPLNIKGPGPQVTTQVGTISRPDIAMTGISVTQVSRAEQRTQVKILSDTRKEDSLSKMLTVGQMSAMGQVSRQVIGAGVKLAVGQDQTMRQSTRMPQVQIQRQLVKTKAKTGISARIIVPPPTVLRKGGQKGKASKFKFTELEFEGKPKGKKKRILRKGLLADFFSVQQTHALGFRATHPAPTPAMWARAERSGYMDVPTVELLKLKGGKRTRWV